MRPGGLPFLFALMDCRFVEDLGDLAFGADFREGAAEEPLALGFGEPERDLGGANEGSHHALASAFESRSIVRSLFRAIWRYFLMLGRSGSNS